MSLQNLDDIPQNAKKFFNYTYVGPTAAATTPSYARPRQRALAPVWYFIFQRVTWKNPSKLGRFEHELEP